MHEVKRLVVWLLLVSLWFHVLFHSPSGVLFTFPSRYYFTIGHSIIFSLTRWSSLIHAGFHVPHTTRDTIKIILAFDYRIFTFSDILFQIFHLAIIIFFTVPRPRLNLFKRFRLFPVRSPLLWESLLLSFPLATKMFQFAKFALFYL